MNHAGCLHAGNPPPSDAGVFVAVLVGDQHEFDPQIEAAALFSSFVSLLPRRNSPGQAVAGTTVPGRRSGVRTLAHAGAHE